MSTQNKIKNQIENLIKQSIQLRQKLRQQGMNGDDISNNSEVQAIERDIDQLEIKLYG